MTAVPRDDGSRNRDRLLEHARKALRVWRERAAEALVALEAHHAGDGQGVERALAALAGRDRAFANFRAVAALLDAAEAEGSPTSKTDELGSWTADEELKNTAGRASAEEAQLAAMIQATLTTLEHTSHRLVQGRDALRGYGSGGTVGVGFVRRA